MSRRFWLPLTASLLLSNCLALNAADPPKIDSYGDPLPEGVLLRLGSTRLATQSNSVWLPDGKTLVTAKDGMLLFWNVADGKLIRSLQVPVRHIFRLQLGVSADGDRIALAGPRGELCVWNLKSLEIVARMPPKPDAREDIDALALSPDGKTLATYDESKNKLRFLDAASCEPRHEVDLGKFRAGCQGFAFSPDSRTIAFGKGDSVQLIAVDGKSEPRVLKDVLAGYIRSLAFSRDGQTLLAAGSNKDQRQCLVRLWDLGAEPKSLADFSAPDSSGMGCVACFGSDDKSAISLQSDKILCWNLSEQKLSRTIEGFQTQTSARPTVSVDPTRRHIAAAIDTDVRLWDLASGRPLFSAEKRHHTAVHNVAWSQDGKTVATAGWDGEAHLWNADSGEHLRVCRSNQDIHSLLFAAGGQRLLVAGDRLSLQGGKTTAALGCFDVASGNLVFETAVDAAQKISLSQNSKIVALSSGDPFGERPIQLRPFQAETGKAIREAIPLDSLVVSMGWAEVDRIFLAACADGNILQFNAETGTQVGKTRLTHINELTGAEEPFGISLAVFSPRNNSVITPGALVGELLRWDLATGKPNWKVTFGGRYQGLELSPDGRLLAGLTYYDGERHLVVLDTKTRETIVERGLGLETGYCLAFSPDGKRILHGTSAGTALIHDLDQARAKLSGGK